MKFKEAVGKVAGLEQALREGLRALRAQDRPHIDAEDTRRLRGSVDVDAALRKQHPNANRWDFAIGYEHVDRNEVVYWVEIHPASDAHINTVIAKAQWLLRWLKNGSNALANFEREIIWVSSGNTSLTPSAPQRKRMAQAGLVQRGRMLRIRNKRGDS
jgi:hypothetical protein